MKEIMVGLLIGTMIFLAFKTWTKDARYEWKAYQQVSPVRIGYKTIEIDGCEYISIDGTTGIAHKGNCRNPEHGR